jgi:hypothetical protein
MSRDSLRRLATAEHHAAAQREVWLGGACATCAREPGSKFCVLRSAARRPEHVKATAGQHSVQSMTRSSNPHGTRAPWTRRRGRGSDDARPSSIAHDPPCVRATLPGQLNGFFLDCFLLARHGQLGRVGRPDEQAEEQAVTGLFRGGSRTDAWVGGREEPIPSKSFAARGAGSKHGDH